MLKYKNICYILAIPFAFLLSEIFSCLNIGIDMDSENFILEISIFIILMVMSPHIIYAVFMFIRKQYITGYSDNKVKPQSYISRAEILTILDRIVKNIPTSISSAKVNGNTLIKDRNVILRNVEIFGNLIIGEIASKSIKLDNVIINGDLILYAPIDIETNLIAVNGKTVKIYENNVTSNEYYLDNVYGIKFSIPDGASAYSDMPENKNNADLIIVNTKQDDKYYFEDIGDISKEKIKNLEYDSIYVKVENGDVFGNPYELYSDNATSHLLIIKRDNIVYEILFMNIVSNNIIDSVLANMEFIAGTNVINHETKIYKNSKLCLKFSYKEGYVGIDDSYNTGNIYSGDSMFKLFIQVNMITDIDEYSINEVKALLKTLIKNDGDILNEKVSKISNHDTILFEIESEDNKIMSLYVIIGNNLYNFIFKGEESKMDTIGKDMFLNIVNSMEF